MSPPATLIQRTDTWAPGLDAALNPRLMAQRLGGDAPCHILDAKYQPGGTSVVLYRVGSRLVLGVLDRDGELETYPFPHDPQLPNMAVAFDAHEMSRALAGVLSGRVVRYTADLVRYRPGRRCTLRLALGVADGSGSGLRRRVLYAKLYHNPAKAAAAHAGNMMVSVTGPVRGVGFARPAGFAPDLNLLLQEPLHGTPLEPVLGVGDGAGAAMAGIGVAALHDLVVTGARLRPVQPALARMGARAEAVADLDPRLGAAMVEVAEGLIRRLERLDGWGAELSLVHGDCKPSQFLIGSSGVELLDLDHGGIADPASDVGDFLASLRVLEARRPGLRAKHTAQVRRSFLDAYCASRRSDGLRLRAGWYEAAALLRKAYRAFQRSPHSQLAPALVTAAADELAALPGGARQ